MHLSSSKLSFIFIGYISIFMVKHTFRFNFLFFFTFFVACFWFVYLENSKMACHLVDRWTMDYLSSKGSVRRISNRLWWVFCSSSIEFELIYFFFMKNEWVFFFSYDFVICACALELLLDVVQRNSKSRWISNSTTESTY